MTSQQPEKIEYCSECELEYAARQCAPCPLCPLRVKLNDAQSEVRRSEPWKIVTSDTTSAIQLTINNLEARGWSLHEFHVGHSRERDVGEPTLFAVMERRDYSPEFHAQAAERVDEVFAQYLGVRRGIEVAAEEFKEARSWGEA